MEQHEIAVGHGVEGYWARCSCGWHSMSANAGARNWNVDGHTGDCKQRGQKVEVVVA